MKKQTSTITSMALWESKVMLTALANQTMNMVDIFARLLVLSQNNQPTDGRSEHWDSSSNLLPSLAPHTSSMRSIEEHQAAVEAEPQQVELLPRMAGVPFWGYAGSACCDLRHGDNLQNTSKTSMAQTYRSSCGS